MLGVISEPLAKLVSCAGPSAASTTVTVSPTRQFIGERRADHSGATDESGHLRRLTALRATLTGALRFEAARGFFLLMWA